MIQIDENKENIDSINLDLNNANFGQIKNDMSTFINKITTNVTNINITNYNSKIEINESSFLNSSCFENKKLSIKEEKILLLKSQEEKLSSLNSIQEKVKTNVNKLVLNIENLSDELKQKNKLINENNLDQNKKIIQNELEIKRKINLMEELTEDIKNKKKGNLELDLQLKNLKEQYFIIKKEREISKLDVEKEIDSLIRLKTLKDNMIQQGIETKNQIVSMRKRNEDLEKINANYIDHLKIIHNELLENKGNIRVFCRVRPLLNKEVQKIEEIVNGNNNVSKKVNESKNSNIQKELEQKKILEFQEGYIEFSGIDKLVLNGPKLKSNIGKSKDNQYKENFNFDRVFNHNTSQVTVFEEISQLIQSAMDGYKVCIFAYGQTGSGKTYTMEGDITNPGIIPRSIEKIFSLKDYLTSLGWDFKFYLSFYEIYLDQLQDLLKKGKESYNMYEYEKMTAFEVNSIEEVKPLLEMASNKRTKAETNCNEKSSRSHSICQLRIKGIELDTGRIREGALNLIDLAGSERIANSLVGGENLKEAVAINKSLLTLKSVISALNNGQTKHVPFRESALTFVLQNYLGGDSKTLMFANISPLISSMNETINSLKFATEVNSCTIK